MFVALGRLLRRQVPSRAAELRELTSRLRAERATTPTADERAAAATIRELKTALARATGESSCCTSCARGMPLPGGAFAGGHCCSGHTPEIFDDVEVAALAQGGTAPRDLPAPATEHAGCAFRGPAGCTLAAENRAALCHRYLCDDLRRALHRAGRLDEVERLCRELDDAYRRFAKLREARLDREWLDEVAPRQAP
jgi:hypothetical protein